MKIVLAPDSFKGSLTALQAAEAMAAGISDYGEPIETQLLPAADGGEGLVDSLVLSTKGKTEKVSVKNPLGREITAKYGVLGDGETCVIEIAEASGLVLLEESEKNPMAASTFGTGQLILHALDKGHRKFIIGLGGSATNDAGSGMLQALGMKFLGKGGKELPEGGAALIDLEHIDAAHFDSRIAESEFIIASDVDNPLVGPLGASFVFGPQKGATEAMVSQLDAGLANFGDKIEQLTGVRLHDAKRAGAAGGAGAAFQAFFPGETQSGIEVVLKAMNFEQQIKNADLVITGEGRTDYQTLAGKTPFGVAKVCSRHGVPVILVSGSLAVEAVEKLSAIFAEIHAVAGEDVPEEDSIQKAGYYLRLKTKRITGNLIARYSKECH